MGRENALNSQESEFVSNIDNFHCCKFSLVQDKEEYAREKIGLSCTSLEKKKQNKIVSRNRNYGHYKIALGSNE
ncbi:hypothetical protein KI387_020814, partial [Taxus chinensis]